MSEYIFWTREEVLDFSKYCRFPLNEHEYPYLFFLPQPFVVKRSLLPLERLIYFSYRFYTTRTDPEHSYTTIAGIVDMIKSQHLAVSAYPHLFLAPFLPEYSHSTSRFMPPPGHPLLNTEEEFLAAFIKLSKCPVFIKQFTAFMGHRAETTCPKCCLYLIILMIKCSYLYYRYKFYTLGTGKVFCDNTFNVYLTQIILGWKPGIDAWPRRHAFIHKIYLLMIKTPYFLKSLNRVATQLNEKYYITIDEKYYKQFNTAFWAGIPVFADGKRNPTSAITQHMISTGAWTQQEFDDNKQLYKMAIYFIFHHFLYDANSVRKSYYHSWVDTNASDSAFLVVFQRDRFPRTVFVRFTRYMISDVNRYLEALDNQSQ